MYVDFLELEVTTSCNASCPQCSRNFYGGPKWPTLPLLFTTLDWIQNKFTLDFLKNLKVIRFCGTYGDPCVHPDLLDILVWIKSVTSADIVINTNGGARSVTWWQDLAKILSGKNDRVVFGIDGLEDTNSLYRRGVNWKKLVANITSFNNFGGNSVWQFLAFEHNQHQIEDAKLIAEQLGFKDFIIKKTTRFVDKKHEITNRTAVMDNKKIYFIKPPTNLDLVNPGYANFDKTHYETVKIECTAKKFSMIYVGADGYVFPCGFLADRLYGFEAEQHRDYTGIHELFEIAGGAHKANLNFTPLSEIINGSWFNTLEESWTNKNRLERCAHQCGLHSGPTEKTFSYMKGELK
jgi:MoaA/NifB/PqqE/SkfB family radical SAM enzyme